MSLTNLTISDADIRRVLRAACKKTGDRDTQLTILARALVCACKSLQVPESVMMREIEKVWPNQQPLMRLLIERPEDGARMVS